MPLRTLANTAVSSHVRDVSLALPRNQYCEIPWSHNDRVQFRAHLARHHLTHFDELVAMLGLDHGAEFNLVVHERFGRALVYCLEKLDNGGRPTTGREMRSSALGCGGLDGG